MTIQEPTTAVKIYVRDNSWDMYIVSDDGIGAPIAVSANKQSMDSVIYALGWQANKESMLKSGYQVSVHHITKGAK